MRNKFTAVVLLFLFAIILGRVIFADVNISPPDSERDFTSDLVVFHNSAGNAYFTTNSTLPFSLIQLDSQYVRFNDTEFRVDSDDRTNITIDYLCFNISEESGGQFVLTMYTTSLSNKVYYNLTNAFDEAYLLYVDNIYEEPLYSSNNNISFNQTGPSDTYHSLKKAHYYDIVVDGYINNADLSNMQSNYFTTQAIRADVNNDGKINYLDRSLLQNRLGEDYV